MRLTDLLIKSLKAPERGQKTYFDDTLKGFGVRVSQGGSKTFVVMVGRDRKLTTLGRYPDTVLADARRRAKTVQGAYKPSDPSKAPSLTFSEAVGRFVFDTGLRAKKRTVDEYERLLKRHFALYKKLDEVSRQDIVEALSSVRHVPSIEHHAFVAVRTMMNWCVRQGLIETSPVPPLRFKTTSRSRVLTDAELRTVWKRAEEVGHPFGTIVQLLILTGQRRGEIAGLRRSWIAGDAITFPEGFTKNKREHRIPLGKITKTILAGIAKDSEQLFPAKGKGKEELPFNGWSKSKKSFDRDLGVVAYTLHDLRRTFASNLAMLDTPIHVTERLLNHISGTISGVAAVYNRHDYWEESTLAIRKWEQRIKKICE